MAVTWPHFGHRNCVWCQQFWFFILLQSIFPVTDRNCWQPMTDVYFLNKLAFEKLPQHPESAPPAAGIIIRSARSPVYSTTFSRHKTCNMSSAELWGTSQGGLCTAVFHTFRLVTPWSPCANLSSHPTTVCHTFTLHHSSLSIMAWNCLSNRSDGWGELMTSVLDSDLMTNGDFINVVSLYDDGRR